MTKFEIRKDSVEVSWKNRKTIKEGIVIDSDNQNPELINSYDTLEEASKAIKNYNTTIRELSGGAGKYYLVEEYYIEENVYDEDGEFEKCDGIWEFSKIIIELVEKPSYNTLATFDNMEEAEEAYNDYEGENEVYISF